MSIIYCVGDIFMEKDAPALAHGCNCAGAMGKGIAQEFKKRWPQMYEVYKKQCNQGLFNVGDVFVWDAEDTIIFNLGTQKTWRTKAEINGIDTALRKMFTISVEKGINKILMPKIGAGLGGLDWQDVKQVIEACFCEASDLSVYICDEYIANTPLIPKNK